MKTLIEMAREADIAVAHMNKPMTDKEVFLAWCNEFAALVLAEREKQDRLANAGKVIEQEPVAWIEVERGIPIFAKFAKDFKPEADGLIALYTTPPTAAQDNSYKALELIAHTQASMKAHAALAAKQMRDAAVRVFGELYKHDRKESGYDEGWNDALDIAEQAIKALTVPEVKWREINDDDVLEVMQKVHAGSHPQLFARAVIAKFKEKQA